MEISLIEREREGEYPNVQEDKAHQGAQYFTNAVCSPSATEYVCEVPMTDAVKNKFALLLFHDPEHGTSTFSTRIKLNGPQEGVLSGAPAIV